ncbi:MAG: FAD-binding oxidoreductase [Halobacteriales archaeon]|nr:FAD-binding oxidoreductase [Halobacteriales archaeon]
MSLEPHPLGTVEQLGESTIAELDATLDGDLILPDHEQYEDARNVWNGLINEYPAVVVRVAGADDVATGIQFAQDHGLELSIRGGAHHQTGAAVVDNGLVIDLADMDRIEVDPDAQLVSVEPGTRAEDVLETTQEHGLAPPTGSAGDVGMAGTTLGGGIGWIRRKHGLSIDALRSVKIVTPDGVVREASRERNEDLFWALRGGGGNFGVVTEFEFDCYEVGPIVPALGIYYPADAAREVLETHRTVMADAPTELTTILIHGHVPPLPPIPDELHGTDAVAILGCYAGDPDEGMSAIAPLREITDPILDLSEPMPYELLHDLGTQMFPWGRNYAWRSVFVDELTDEIHNVILEQKEAAPGPMDAIDIWAMGGNIGHGGDAAFNWADKRYLIVAEANWEEFNTQSELEWVRTTERRLRQAGGVGSYAGFTGVEEQEWENWANQVYGTNYDRLSEIKRQYDPDNVFNRNVTILPAD